MHIADTRRTWNNCQPFCTQRLVRPSGNWLVWPSWAPRCRLQVLSRRSGPLPSRRHWFLRARLWSAIAAPLPIGADEPALLFAISSPLTVAAICGWRAIASRLVASGTIAAADSPPLGMRFSVRDLFLLGGNRGAIACRPDGEVVRNLRLIDASGLAAYVAALVGLGVASYGVVFGQRHRYWTFAGAAGAITVATYLLAGTAGDWLKIRRPLLENFERLRRTSAWSGLLPLRFWV